LNHAKTSFSTEICAGAIIGVVQQGFKKLQIVGTDFSVFTCMCGLRYIFAARGVQIEEAELCGVDSALDRLGGH
jgi:hypothetical protein